MTAATAFDLHTDARPRSEPLVSPRWAWIGGFAAVALIAFLIRLVILLRIAGLDGLDGYDDGVYYAAADALVHGRIPYRDFLLLQPPGAILALAPFAAVGSVLGDPAGVALGRVCFIAVGSLNAVLAMGIARRFGRTAAVIGGVGYAVYFPAAHAERSTLLEPLGTCGLLVAVLLIERAAAWPRLGPVLAGVAAGAAVTMRIWYVVPVLLIAAVHWRRAPRFLLGAAGAAGVICAPFFLTAPAVMVREVLLDQLGRPRATSASSFKRLATYLGATDLHLPGPFAALLGVNELGLLLMLVVLAAAIAACTVRGARLYPLAGAAAAVVLLASPTFFLHYAALAAPWVVLTVAVGGARILTLVPRKPARLIIAALVVLAAAALGVRSAELSQPSPVIPVDALRPAASQVAGCVESDDPQILAALDVLSRDLERGCVVRPDVTGYTFDRDSYRVHGTEAASVLNPLWQADVTRFLLSGQAVIVHRTNTKLDRADTARVQSGAVIARSGSWVLHAVGR
ncbi:hypothetical protein QDR37_14375 [Amnibacterium sp. CER49]|uniref:hypothetical protein n=1 Tax=Amnibacterium sp. CER49 TaxID=3039161 RepID=UPI002446C317|nr:hypothetical protein [Amnibacterium sp. CER49]MDH2445136.1 hypothetical protein [Amnibacterium sp. CER49]